MAEADRVGRRTGGPFRWFERFVDRLVDAGVALSAASVVLILLLVCVEVGMRLLSRSTMVADELAGYLNVAIVFLGMAYTLREGGFIRIEILYEKMPPLVKRVADAFSVTVSLVFVCGLGYFLALHVLYAFRHDTRAVTVLQTPEYLPQSVTVIGCTLLALQLLVIMMRPSRRVP